MEAYEIKGQCVTKRAFEVAAAGDLRVLLVGPLGSSKTTVREAFPSVDSAEMETCPCGHFHDVRQDCICTARTIIRWYRRLERKAREYDIILECCPLSARELLYNRKPDVQEQEWMLKRISAAREFGKTHTVVDLYDDAALRTMEMACRRLSLTPGQYNAVLRTTRAIANLDQSKNLKAKHIAEAIQYRADTSIYRLDRIGEDRPTYAS